MNDERVIVEADKRLSQSLLWEIQRRYFLSAGIDAWRDDVVPHQISCNPVMARAYVELVIGYLRDCETAKALDPAQTVYVIELGAGSGRLLYHFIHQFEPLRQASRWGDLSFKYILTDFVPETIEFWQNHKQLRPLVDDGILDFARFDVNEMGPLVLVESGDILTPESVHNPLILMANYFFDSIPQDSFLIEDGELQENLLTLYSAQPEPALEDPTVWERLELAYEGLPLQEPYAVDVYNEILAWYEAVLPDSVLTFPNVGLDCMRFWQRYGRGRNLWLTADRGYASLEALVAQGDPLLNLHGSFSMMVNYQAIASYVELSGGKPLQTDHYQNNIQVSAYLLGAEHSTETELAFERAVDTGGPDAFFALKQVVEQRYAEMSLPQLLSFLRQSHFDAEVFRDCYEVLVTVVKETDAAWHEDITVVLDAIDKQ